MTDDRPTDDPPPTGGLGEREGEVAVPADGLLLDAFVPYLLNRIVSRLNTDLSDELRTFGLSQQHWRILAVLATRAPRTLSELVVYTVTPQSTLSRLVDRMERDGLVLKQGVEEDGRVVTVDLTEAGHSAFQRILPVAMRHCEHALAGFSTRERESLLHLLHKLLANIRRSPYL